MLLFKEGRKFVSQSVGVYRRYIPFFILSEIMSMGAVFFSNLAMSSGPVSLVRAVESAEPVFVIIFTLLIYPFFPQYAREAMHGGMKKKILLMVCIVFGIYLIN